MDQKDQEIGFEFICISVDCRFNDNPVCVLQKPGQPVITTTGGRCKNYEKKEGKKE